MSAPAQFDLAAIAAALGPLAGRFDVDLIAEADSSNARLLARAEQGAPSGTVVVVERQTAGRGRLGRDWHSTPDCSLTFSLLWRLPAERPPAGLSLAVGVAVADALAELGADGIRLKWPNDILREDGKLGGILIELAPGPPWAAVIGIGLNLALPPEMPDELRQTATALPAPVAPNALLAALLQGLCATLDTFAAQGFAALRPRWLALNAHADRPVRILSPYSAPIDGRCLGVDEDGALLLASETGLRRILSGDVSLRPA
jgi:BirA family biotin operon repressor/biotin-[acetyl-CoA-carboxylase] ligase